MIKALKLFCIATLGRLHPLVHPACGLTQRNILHYCWELGHFVHLKIAVQDVVDYGFVGFPKIHECTEDLQECQHKLLGLLGFDKEQQHLIIEKIKAFISKKCHRVIIDIHLVGKQKELEDMWCNEFTTNDQHNLLE
jgi:hypothetical protein